MSKNEQNIIEEKDSSPKQIFSNAKEAINNFVKGHSRSNSETFVDDKKKKRQWFTKTKEELKIESNTQSSSIELKDDLIKETLETNQEDKKVECDCHSHEGKEFLSNVYNLSVEKIFDCLFNTESEFNKAYLAANKFSNLKAEEWKDDCRKLEYNVDVGAFGKTNNIEQQKILKKNTNECYVIITQVTASGVMYADCMTIITKFCITKFSSKTSKLNVCVNLEYKKKPNVVSRGIIERNTFSNMKSCFEYIDKNLVLLNPDFKIDETIYEHKEDEQTERKIFRIQEKITYDNGILIFNRKIGQTKLVYSIILIIFLFFIFNLRLYFRINRTEEIVLETLKSAKIK